MSGFVMAADAEPPLTGLQVRAIEPRAFGHRIGDVIERTVEVDVPAGLTLDVHSLPEPGPVSPVLELRSLTRREQAIAGGSRLSLVLRYQWFTSPPVARVYELPTLRLRFTGDAGRSDARDQEARVESWPVVIGPLMPEAVSPRDGLGELRPDTVARPGDAQTPRRWLFASLGLAALPALWLLSDTLGWPRRRVRGPFEAAWQGLASKPAGDAGQAWRDAARALHTALNAAAGRVVLGTTLDDALAGLPHLQPLADDWRRFFARSDRAFYAAPPGAIEAAPADSLATARGLLVFARACRDAERRVR